METSVWLRFLGWFVLVVALLDASIDIVRGDWLEVLFFCGFAVFVLSAGILLNKRVLIGATLLAAVPAQFLWILAYVLYFFGITFGRIEWIFGVPWWEAALSIILHVLLIPIAIFGVYVHGFDARSFRYCLIIFILFLLPVSYVVGGAEYNVNCTHYSCDAEGVPAVLDEGVGYLVREMLFWSGVVIIEFGGYWLWTRKRKGFYKVFAQKKKKV